MKQLKTFLILILVLVEIIYSQREIDVDDIKEFGESKGIKYPKSLREVPPDLKGVKKWTREEYIKERGKINEIEGLDSPDILMEYAYECLDGRCEYVSGLRVLVLGGTQYLGRLLLEHLLKDDLRHLTMINRGKTNNPFDEKQVKHVKADRLFDQKTLIEELKDLTFYDVVVDFTGIHGIHLFHVVQELIGKTQHYIYISCANVYYFGLDNPDEKWKEKAFSPPEETSPDAILLQRRYGNDLLLAQGKLTAENFLMEQYEKHNFHVTIIRIPDVVGPYDNKGRYLGLQLGLLRDQTIGTKGLKKKSKIQHCLCPRYHHGNQCNHRRRKKKHMEKL